MGRKPTSNNKHKEKRQVRKEEQRKIADATAIVTAANSSTADLISSYFSELHLFENNELKVELKCCRVKHLDATTLEWAIDLTEKNMRTLYENCAWGWDARRKREELTDDAAWYLVATNLADGNLVGFSHFRFDVDFGQAVLYCYELQLEEGGRRRGLGARLLTALEAAARGARMTRVRLTALRHNAPAGHSSKLAGTRRMRPAQTARRLCTTRYSASSCSEDRGPRRYDLTSTLIEINWKLHITLLFYSNPT